MAKAKKSTPAAAKPTEAAPKAAKVAAKKKTAKPAAASTAGVPQIDTSLAAANAARMIGAKATSAPATDATKETSTFKQLKESMNKPATGGIHGFLNSTASPGSKKSGSPFGGAGVKPTGRNQTFGADVNRFNVPRRTGG